MKSYLLCFALSLNALCAGGMFTFPLMSPALAAHNKLSQPHLTTIILAGMMSQYPVAVVVGSLTDQYGPAMCTFIGGLLFVAGFGGFSLEVHSTLPNVLRSSQTSFYRMVFWFLLIGLGTVFAYCASLFAASKYFASHIGLASGAMMAIFALSPLFFSSIATHFFMDPATGLLNVAPFTAFVALVTGIVSIFVSTILGYLPPPEITEIESNSSPIEGAITEETALLLVPDSESTAIAIDIPIHPNTIGELVKTVDFWLFATYCLLILGASEMVISNIGTISESLPAAPYRETLVGVSTSSSTAALQVKLLSIANTVSRIVVGPLADFASPIAGFLPSGARTFHRKHYISRFSFLTGAALLLSVTFIWLVVGVQNEAQLWTLSIGTGLSYSATFTVIPSLLSSLWGLQHLGRNFGFMMYAPFTGTPIFSYIYASISASQTEAGETICKGRSCWELTFSLSIVTSIISVLISFVLWKRWQNKI